MCFSVRDPNLSLKNTYLKRWQTHQGSDPTADNSLNPFITISANVHLRLLKRLKRDRSSSSPDADVDERGIPTIFEAQRHLASHCAHVVFFKSTGIPCKPKPFLLPSSVKGLVVTSTFYSFAAMGVELRFSKKGNSAKGVSWATVFLAFHADFYSRA